MKYIQLQSGGMPFDLDDIDFSQNAVKEALRGFISAICPQNCILQGCDYSQSQHPTDFMLQYVSISAGFIWLGGEICRVEAQRIVIDVDFGIVNSEPKMVACLKKATIFHHDGLVGFADGVARDTYGENIGLLVADFASESTIQVRNNTPRLRQILGIDPYFVTISSPSFNWQDSSIVVSKIGGVYYFQGRLVNFANNMDRILTLSDCKPSRTQYCVAFSDAGEAVVLRLGVDGSVTPLGLPRPIVANCNFTYT